MGLCLLGPDKALVQFMDRFEVLRFFEPNRKLPDHPLGDTQQYLTQLEEFVQFLITLISFRSKMTRESVESQIRKELVQFLVTSNLSFSELNKKVSDSMTDHVRFTSILEEVAVFKPPDGVSDRGIYELKEQCYPEVNKFFHRYSANEFSAADERLGKWFEKEKTKTNPILLPPPFTPLKQDSIFRNFDTIFGSSMFARVAFYGLSNLSHFDETISKDSVIERILYLLLQALDQEKHLPKHCTEPSFSHSAFFNKFKVYIDDGMKCFSLGELIAHLYKDTERKEFQAYKAELKYILQQLAGLSEYGRDVFENIPDLKMFMESMEVEKSEMANGKISEVAHKQQQMMEALAQNQKALLDQLEAMYGSESDDEDTEYEDAKMVVDESFIQETSFKFQSDPCIVCQKDMCTSSSPTHGLVGLVRSSCLNYKVESISDLVTFNSGTLIGKECGESNKLQETPTLGINMNRVLQKTGGHFVSCGHQMHLPCFEVILFSALWVV
jgi:E3 ubiquitin-protein ligase UBR1